MEIKEYKSQDQQRLKEFYTVIKTKEKHSRILNALYESQGAKRTWQAGIVCIIGIHITQWSTSDIPTILLKLLLWSTGVGMIWYKLLSREFNKKLQQSTEKFLKEMETIPNNEKSNAWILIDEDKNEIIGSVALKYEKNEGKVGYLTGQSADNRKQLVQHAFKFGRANKIQVLSKWGDEDSKWSESFI